MSVGCCDSQLFRAGTGVAANYRAACRSRSKREFAARLAIVVEEADEAEYWLDILGTLTTTSGVKEAKCEAAELRAIFAAARATTLTTLRTVGTPNQHAEPR